MISPELLSSTTRTQLSSQLSFATSMAESMIESMEKLMGLNLQAAKASLDMSLGSAQQLMSSRDGQDFLHLSGSQFQPHTDIAMTYVRHLNTIASDTQMQLGRIMQEHVSENSREMVSIIDALGNNAPETSKSTLGMLKSAIDNAASGYQQITQTTQKAIGQLESSINAASTPRTTTSPKSNGRSKK